MAEKKTSAALRPIPGVRRGTTPFGVTHVRTYQSGQYVVVGNHLAQHRELSLTAIGLATHIMSLPEGAPVDIRSLAERFPEGRDRIAFALRELEAHGYLERVRERTEAGRLVTRTYAHHTPGRAAATGRARGRSAAADGSGESPHASQEDDRGGAAPPSACELPAPDAQTEPVFAEPPRSSVAPLPPVEDVGDDERQGKAVTLLAGLRRVDERLTFSQRDVNRLAPAVIAWFDRGVPAAVVRRALTVDLPADLRSPAAVVAYRLRESLPAPLPARCAPPAPTADDRTSRRPHPFQTCDGCERAFRAPQPGRCRECRDRRPEHVVVLSAGRAA
ncbi:helix-turn-helix domain-containing protein [Streptomyces sp. NPDC000987]|uniref:helix-turn-helix domain-containing protein n=1 Tax=Streptomyces sp. NPDC000987 TaxID=3154374 RepID=UPI0033341BE3